MKQKKKITNVFVGAILTLVFLLVDLASKQWFYIKDRVVWNDGAFLGLGSGFFWEGVMAAILIFVGWVFLKSRHMLEKVALALIFSGGAGNFIDRLFFGAVRDFIYYPYFDFYGNVADVFLVVGVVLVGVYELFVKPGTIPA